MWGSLWQSQEPNWSKKGEWNTMPWFEEFRTETRGFLFFFREGRWSCGSWLEWVLVLLSHWKALHLDREPFCHGCTGSYGPYADIAQWHAEVSVSAPYCFVLWEDLWPVLCRSTCQFIMVARSTLSLGESHLPPVTSVHLSSRILNMLKSSLLLSSLMTS